MRGYDCHFYHLTEKKELIKNNNTACWAGIQSMVVNRNRKEIHGIPLDLDNRFFIFIDRFTQDETKAYIPLLIRIVNKITPCELVEIDKKQYIKVKLLDTYDQSLIILNFIRNLWSCPTIFNGRAERFKEYIPKFFETLKTSRKHKDPLKRLLYANKVACEVAGTGSMGHSNIHNHQYLLIKPVEDLLKYDGHSTSNFLTGRY